MTRAGTRRPRVRDPYGLLPDASWLAPGLSALGLLVVAVLTLNLLGGSIPFVTGSGSGGGGANRTAAPSNVVVVPPVTFPGSIVYAKAGNIWVQHGQDVRQLTTGGRDSMPSWSPDGTAVYFIRTTDAQGLWPAQGVDRHYQESVPAIMRVDANGTGAPETVLTGTIQAGSRSWFSWIRQPVLSPDGQTVAMVSDGPDPTRSDVVLQFYDLVTKKRTVPAAPESAPLGHQDPAWRADGRFLLFVRNGRDAARGAPEIVRWDIANKKATQLTGPGYLEPSYSPDGAYIAATRTTSFGNDVVILEAAHGRELLRVTTDGRSWAPVWSPAGDAIAFLHIEGQIVDLKLARLAGPGPDWTVTDTIDLTQVSGLDGGSRPAWYIPPDELPATPPPTTAPDTSAGASVAP
ncbi:MAG: PD40 domain-containing protein [Chloroflexi bacterium]|nr:PD40 domain-containing protein [Chloroflexota bacterium]